LSIRINLLNHVQNSTHRRNLVNKLGGGFEQDYAGFMDAQDSIDTRLSSFLK